MTKGEIKKKHNCDTIRHLIFDKCLRRSETNMKFLYVFFFKYFSFILFMFSYVIPTIPSLNCTDIRF